MQKKLFIVGLVLSFLGMASPALAMGYGGVVTAPSYWCGTYYSSYPCTYQPYAQSNYPQGYSNMMYGNMMYGNVYGGYNSSLLQLSFVSDLQLH